MSDRAADQMLEAMKNLPPWFLLPGRVTDETQRVHARANCDALTEFWRAAYDAALAERPREERRFTAATPDELDFANEKDRARAWKNRRNREQPRGEEERIERAAKAICATTHVVNYTVRGGLLWDEIEEEERQMFREQARAALNAEEQP